MRAPLPRRDWRKTVTASQGFALVIAAAGVVPTTVSRVLLAIALAMLAESFGRDVWWLWRRRRRDPLPLRAVARRRPRLGALLTTAALLVVWAALVAPIRPWQLTPGSFVRLPLEGLALLVLAVALPTRARRFVPWLIGPLLGVLVSAEALRPRLLPRFDRQFNPVEDWSYLSIGVGDGARHLRQQGRRPRGSRGRGSRARAL